MKKITIDNTVPCTKFFSPEIIEELREAIYREFVAQGTVTQWYQGEKVSCLRLLGSARHWVIDRNKKLIYNQVAESDDTLAGNYIDTVFPAPYSRGTTIGCESPGSILSRVIKANLERLARSYVEPVQVKIIDDEINVRYSLAQRFGGEYRITDQDDTCHAAVEVLPVPGTTGFAFYDQTVSSLATHLGYRILAKDRGMKIVRSMTAKLWGQIPREPLRLAMMCRFSPSSLMISLAWRNLEALQEAEKKASFMLPLWMHLAVDDAQNLFRRHAQKSNAFKISRVGKMPAKGVIEIVGNFLGDGLKPKAWRWMTRKNAKWAKPLVNENLLHRRDRLQQASVLVDLLNLVSEAGNELRFWFYSWFVSIQHRTNNVFRDDLRFEDNIALLRAASRETAKLKSADAREAFKQEFFKVLDWWRFERPKLDHNQRKADWKWFSKKQEKWHLEMQQREYEESVKPWETPVKVYRKGTWAAFALNNGLSLYYEGQFMRNCVYSYQEDCHAGQSLIFHLAQLKPRKEIDEPQSVEQLYEMLGKKSLFKYHATAEINISDSIDDIHLWQIETFCTEPGNREAIDFAYQLIDHIKTVEKWSPGCRMGNSASPTA